jgi:hypothetical protein
MITIPFDYSKHLRNRTPLLQWVLLNNGTVIRDKPKHSSYLGKILYIEFIDELDAIAFKLRFGV